MCPVIYFFFKDNKRSSSSFGYIFPGLDLQGYSISSKTRIYQKGQLKVVSTVFGEPLTVQSASFRMPQDPRTCDCLVGRKKLSSVDV